MKTTIVIVLLASTFTNRDIGTIKNNHYVEFKNGGYYTEKQLQNTNEKVIIIGDIMISKNEITILK